MISQEAEITEDQHYFAACNSTTTSKTPNRQETRLPSKRGSSAQQVVALSVKNCAGKFFIGLKN